MQVFARTDKGKKRQENQDRVRYKALDDETIFVIVCDGMGGENAGGEASEIAVNVIFDRITLNYRSNFDGNSIRNMMLSGVSAANTIIYSKSVNDRDKFGMGTTCVCAVIKKDIAYIANVGDSRAYILSGNNIVQITKDHTFVQMLYEQGKITKEEMSTHAKRNIITRAVGVNEKVDTDYFEEEITQNSIILLCTDGLSEYCSNETLLNIIDFDNINKSAQQLVSFANECGGKDNITLAIVAN